MVTVKSVLITVDPDVWEEYAKLFPGGRSQRIRKFIIQDVKREKRRRAR